MTAEILCVGTELLLGDIVNTNAAFLARELAACGIRCYHQSVVGDNPERLRDALVLALGRSDMVITTGGLGPTYDDLTKETVAAYFGLPLQLHAPSLQMLEQRMTAFGHTRMPQSNKKQAYMPKGATVFANTRGTANGLCIEQNGKTAILLPGPPREMQGMFADHVAPFLAARSGACLYSRNLHFFGIGESALESELREMIADMTNPSVAPYAKEGEVLLRVTAQAQDKAGALALIDPVVQTLCARYPQHVYGVDIGSLQNALVQELIAQGRTVATGESCTGGLVSRRITEIPGASQVFGCGICTYSNQAKQQLLGVSGDTLRRHGAVSPQTAVQMARGARLQGGADLGLAVTGIAGPGGGSAEKPVGLVYIAASTPLGDTVRELRLGHAGGGARDFIQVVASSHLLYLGLEVLRRGLG